MCRWLILFMLSAPLLAATETFSADGIVFIVNSSNPVTSLTNSEIRDYFFKTKRDWPDGSPVRFLDKNNSPERDLFLKTVIKKSQEEVDRYWIGQKLYSGNSAPVQSSSDRMAIQFVSAFKGAIGYISGSTVIDNKTVKILKVGD